MSKKYILIASALIAAAGLAAALLVFGPVGRDVPSAPPDSGTNAPSPDGGSPSPDAAALNAEHAIAVGESVRFTDGLLITLLKIDDSRCPPDVQCVWAGELSPTFRAEGGRLAEAAELRLGTATRTTGAVGPYDVTLRGATEATATISVSLRPPTQPTSDDRIRVSAPIADALVTSPLVITGEARGTWYFEASFPVKLFDADGKLVVAHYAQAQGEWMTPEFVPFSSTLTFAMPTTATGTLVLEKDNPSGLPEHDASVSIPVRFSVDAVGTVPANCRKSGCSGQICADEDMASDCMFRPEYACYRTATCERQADGKCGWTQTPELTQCLQNPPSIE